MSILFRVIGFQKYTERYRKQDESSVYAVPDEHHSEREMNLPISRQLPPEVLKNMEQTTSCLEKLSLFVNALDTNSRHTTEWHLFALILDRIFLAVYMLITVAGCLALVLQFIDVS